MLRLGKIYEVIIDESVFPMGTRVEFCGGSDGDIFIGELDSDYLDESEVRLSDDQTPLTMQPDMQSLKHVALMNFE